MLKAISIRNTPIERNFLLKKILQNIVMPEVPLNTVL